MYSYRYEQTKVPAENKLVAWAAPVSPDSLPSSDTKKNAAISGLHDMPARSAEGGVEKFAEGVTDRLITPGQDVTEGSLKSSKGAQGFTDKSRKPSENVAEKQSRPSERPASQSVNDELTKAKFNPDRDTQSASPGNKRISVQSMHKPSTEIAPKVATKQHDSKSLIGTTEGDPSVEIPPTVTPPAAPAESVADDASDELTALVATGNKNKSKRKKSKQVSLRDKQYLKSLKGFSLEKFDENPVDVAASLLSVLKAMISAGEVNEKSAERASEAQRKLERPHEAPTKTEASKTEEANSKPPQLPQGASAQDAQGMKDAGATDTNTEVPDSWEQLAASPQRA